MPKIAVDAMGGDRAPAVVVEGALLAAQEFGADIVLVGPPDVVAAELAKHPGRSNLPIVAASQVVPMHESPKRSSFKDWQPSPEFAAIMHQPVGGTDSTQIISEDRDGT